VVLVVVATRAPLTVDAGLGDHDSLYVPSKLRVNSATTSPPRLVVVGRPSWTGLGGDAEGG